MNRRALIALLGARQRRGRSRQAPMPVIGYLKSGSSDAGARALQAFRRGL